MSKFKAGDQVYWENELGEPRYHVVGQVTGEQVWFQNGGWMPEDEVFLVNDPEDLPKSPCNVRYECNQNPGKDFLEVKRFIGHVFISVEEDGKDSQIELTPDSALQLSADLLRIALQLKREEEVE